MHEMMENKFVQLRSNCINYKTVKKVTQLQRN